MSNQSRLFKLEKAANEHRKQKHRRQKSILDFSTFTDEELDLYYDEYIIANPFIQTNEYEGLTERELSDLYMASIRSGQLKNSK